MEVKTFWKFRFSGCFSKVKTVKSNQKVWDVFDQFGITIPCSSTYFLEVGARVSLKVATKGSLGGKNILKIKFLGCFSKAKTQECEQKVWNIFDQLGITIRCSPTYFLKVGARVSLKVATKVCLAGKKTLKI